MQLLTIVEAYVHAAMERAQVEREADGTLAAYVPGCKGVLAFGADVHECSAELYKALEDWVKVSLANHSRLTPIGGMDLNADARRILKTYEEGTIPTIDGDFYENGRKGPASGSSSSGLT